MDNINTRQNERDLERTRQLAEYINSHISFETEDEVRHRSRVLDRIKELAQHWIKEVSLRRGMASAYKCQAKIYTFGSYKLGVQNRGDDIDILLVAPRHATMDDFFGSFRYSLSIMEGVEYMRSVRTAYVPVIKMRVDGIKLDIVFATLPVHSISQDQGLSKDALLKGLDEKNVRSLIGCRVTDEILRLTYPNRESFKLALRAIKLWAKKKGIYSQILGYFGGVSWTILVAYIMQKYPQAPAAVIVNKLFNTFYNWPWPQPVLIKALSGTDFGFPRFREGKVSARNARHRRMPIITPKYPEQNCAFRVTESAKAIIVKQFARAKTITDQIMMGLRTWDDFFKPIDFFGQYISFVVVTASAQSEWISFVESKIRDLVVELEGLYFIDIAHAYPYPDKCPVNESSYITWYIGLHTVGKAVLMDQVLQSFKTMALDPAKLKFEEMYPDDTLSIDIKCVSREVLLLSRQTFRNLKYTT